jgi:hypothetical protein
VSWTGVNNRNVGSGLRVAICCFATSLAIGCSDSAPNPASDAITIIRGDPTTAEWLTVTIDGRGLVDLEGRVATARIGVPDRPPERLAFGQVRIVDGAFTMTFPDVWEYGLYKQKLLFIDVDGDGACVPGIDRAYADWRAGSSDLVLTVAGSMPPAQPNTEMPAAFSDSDCTVHNQPWPGS